MTTKYRKEDLVDADSVFDKPFSAGEFLEMNRVELGWTKRKMAKLLGLKGQEYGNIANGQTSVSVSRAIKWEKVIDELGLFSGRMLIKHAIDDQLRRHGTELTVRIVDPDDESGQVA